MPAIFLTSATTATRRPRRSSTCFNTHRTCGAPALVNDVRRCRSELEFLPGVSPRYGSSRCAFANRSRSSMAAANLIATTGPTPGTVISRWQVSSFFAKSASSSSASAICSFNVSTVVSCRSTNCGSLVALRSRNSLRTRSTNVSVAPLRSSHASPRSHPSGSACDGRPAASSSSFARANCSRARPLQDAAKGSGRNSPRRRRASRRAGERGGCTPGAARSGPTRRPSGRGTCLG